MATMTDARVSALRARLLAANVLMRYDYAWKEVEFSQAETRVTGIVSRLLYQYAMWRTAVRDHIISSSGSETQTDAAETSAVVPHKVFIDANGFDVFSERCAQACRLMGFDVLERERDDIFAADLVFVFVAPPSEERVDEQFATFESFVAHQRAGADTDTDTDSRSPDDLPMFCFLLGEADFLAPPQDDEAERLRGLSEFAIAQQLHPRMQTAAYSSVAQFAVEFTPASPGEAAEQDAKQAQLQQLMKGFGCVDHNLMHYTEKWEFYAPAQSALCRDDELTHPADTEVLYWLELAKDRTCHFCHAASSKLSRCARCQDARYCSRDCQRAAWKFHKRLCGKTPEEITS